jgi:transcriptional regulator with PAS, ATPase and Fis domain
MKTISPSIFLTSLAKGLDCTIYYFDEEKTLIKARSKHSMTFKSLYTLSKGQRKEFIASTHPIIKTWETTFEGSNINIQGIYTPILDEKKGLLWLFFKEYKDFSLTKDSYLDFDDNLVNMLNTLCETITLLISLDDIKEKNSLYSQSAAFIGNLISNGLMLYDKEDKLLFYNKSAERMGITNIDSTKLSNNKIFNMNTNELYLGNKLVGKLKYTSNQANFKNNLEYEKNSIKSFNKIIGKDPRINRVLSIVNQVAPTDGTVLLRGESGTGKEEYAKLIHTLSNRRNRPFIALNCATIPENLLESELFGYEGGSFTGAKKEGKIGKFQMADTGTLFLDEIGDMPTSIQVKLLRVLQERYIEPVGSNKEIPIDVRIICATHQNLEDKIAMNEFREDLYYRINVIPIDIPSLNNRHDDIELLLTYYVKKYCISQRKGFMAFSYAAMKILKNYHWQGNIRELMNVIEYCVTMSNKSIIDVSDLPAYIKNDRPTGTQNLSTSKNQRPNRPTAEELYELVRQFGKDTEGKKNLAKHLDISLATLYRWLSKYKIKN